MRKIRYQKLNAFTAGESLGNPAAVLYLPERQTLSEREMLAIAREHRGFVSEVVYCARKNGTIHLTFYSSEGEVDFCGHGTIGCMYSLFEGTPEMMDRRRTTIETNRRGPLTVYNELQTHNAVMVASPKPVYMGTGIEAEVIADNLGVAQNVLLSKYPVDLIDAGLKTLIVPIRRLTKEITITPGENRLKAFCETEGIDIVLIYSLEVADKNCIAHTRVFSPRFGYLEDPATGSGNSAFGYYMMKNRLWDGANCLIEQGGGDSLYNQVRLTTVNGEVLFGGAVTLRVDGVYCLEDKEPEEAAPPPLVAAR